MLAKLERGADIVLDVHSGLLGFKKKFPRAANPEAVVRRFGGFADFDGVFVDNILVCLSIAALVVNVPAERFEKRVQEFTAKLGFVVLWRAVGVDLALKALDEFEDDLGHSHFFRGS